MERILAIVVLLTFVWLAIPRLIQGQWFAPTAIAPDSWVLNSPYDTRLAEASATPPQGFGWFHFDFWNTPTTQGEVITTADTRFRRPKDEFRY